MSNFAQNFLHIKMPQDFTIKLPYFIYGRGEPILYIQAAQHGVELTGIYTIRLLMERLRGTKIEGTLILVPIANPLAVKWRRHFYKMELGERYSDDHPHQMNRVWPGNKDGNETERLAYALYENLIAKADYVIDLHCWEMWRCSCALGHEWDSESVEMCRYSLLNFIRLMPRKYFTGRKANMLSFVVTVKGGHAIVIEHSGQRWIFVDEAKRVCEGIINIMRYLGIVPEKPVSPKRQFVVGKDPHVNIIAPDGDWILTVYKRPGDSVVKNEVIASLLDIETFKEHKVHSPINGIIYEIGATRPNVDTRPSDEVMVILKGEKYRIATIYETRL